MNQKLDKNLFRRLSQLARIKLEQKEIEKLTSDLEKIVEYFNDIKNLTLKDKEISIEKRESFPIKKEDTNLIGKGRNSFPDKKGGFLKVPPVFE